MSSEAKRKATFSGIKAGRGRGVALGRVRDCNIKGALGKTLFCFSNESARRGMLCKSGLFLHLFHKLLLSLQSNMTKV